MCTQYRKIKLNSLRDCPKTSSLPTSMTREAKTEDERCDPVKSHNNSTQGEWRHQTVGKPWYPCGREICVLARVLPVDILGTSVYTSGAGTGTVPWYPGNVVGSFGSYAYRETRENMRTYALQQRRRDAHVKPHRRGRRGRQGWRNRCSVIGWWRLYLAHERLWGTTIHGGGGRPLPGSSSPQE